MMILTGCVSAVVTNPLCSGTEKSRTAHANELAGLGASGAGAVRTGRVLIAQLDAGCNNT